MRIACLVQGLPGNEQRHDNGLARAGRHLQGDAKQSLVQRVGVLGQRGLEVMLRLGRLFGEKDRRFDCLALTKEQRAVPSVDLIPVGQQSAAGLGRTGIPAVSPQRNSFPDLIDELVLFNTIDSVEVERRLRRALLFGPRDRGEVQRATPTFGFGFGDNAAFVELKVILRFDERRVDDRIVNHPSYDTVPL